MKLASRRWWYLMPVVFVTYSLAYLARANYGFAAAAGMAADLHISQELNALNVVALPHIGSATYETRFAMSRLAVDNLVAALDGKPQNVVNRAAIATGAATT
jgi:hypothetical protein